MIIIQRLSLNLPTLRTLTLDMTDFEVGDPQGTLVSNVIGTIQGSTVTFNALSVAGSLQLVNVSNAWQIQVGPTAPGTPGSITFSLVETLLTATNTPKTTTGFVVTESGLAADPILQLVLDMSRTYPLIP